jgi:uncharacterized protein (DUF1330 family)
MAKGYWITLYHSVSNPDALAEYGKHATRAIEDAGGRFVVRGFPSETREAGIAERTVVIEFDSVEKAIATYESPAYQAALRLLKGSAKRDIRFAKAFE